MATAAQQAQDSEQLLRVEELARAADLSVDTIRFYQKRRLLPAPTRQGRVAWYGTEHLARLGRIRELQARGFSLAVIRRLLDGELDATDEPLAAAIVGARVGDDRGELLTLAELAERAGIDESLLAEVAADGLLVPQHREGVDWYSASDVDLVRAGLALLDAGFPLLELLDLAKRQHEMTLAVAERAVRLFDDHVREPFRDAALTEDEKAQRLVETFATLLPTVTTLVAGHFRSVLLETAQEHLEVGTLTAPVEPDCTTST